MMTYLRLAFLGAAILPLLYVFAQRSIPPPPVAAATVSFDETWRDAAYPLVLRKIDSLFDVDPKLIQTEVITPPKEEEPKPKVIKEARQENNICTRHGMRKMEIRGGKSWRCRK